MELHKQQPTDFTSYLCTTGGVSLVRSHKTNPPKRISSIVAVSITNNPTSTMAFNKLMVMLPLMFAARKLDGEDEQVIFMLRCAYFSVQFIISLSVIYVFVVCNKISQSKFKGTLIYVAPAPTPLADPNAKVQYKQITFGEHIYSTARSLLTSTLFGIVVTSGLHYYRGMIVGLAMQSIMGPLNLFENKLAKAILLSGGFKDGESPQSRKFFDEKYREDLTKDDDVVDAEGKVIVFKKEVAGEASKKKDSKRTFEAILLDTWDEGEKADVMPLMNALNKNNANFKISQSGWTPLMIMSALGAPKSDVVIKKLKELKANASVVDGEGWNALHWVAFHGCASGAKTLLEEYGVNLGLQDVKDKEGKTALEHAKQEKNNDVVKVIEEMVGGSEESKGLTDKDGIRKRK